MDQHHVVGSKFRNADGSSTLSYRDEKSPNIKNRDPLPDALEKLADLEKRMKSKFTHVQKLESALERTLGMHKSTNSNVENKSNTTLGASENGTNPQNKLLTSILRVIRKLKIELHADYLILT